MIEKGRCTVPGCSCNLLITKKAIPGICARCHHPPSKHADLDAKIDHAVAAEDRQREADEAGKRARAELLDRIAASRAQGSRQKRGQAPMSVPVGNPPTHLQYCERASTVRSVSESGFEHSTRLTQVVSNSAEELPEKLRHLVQTDQVLDKSDASNSTAPREDHAPGDSRDAAETAKLALGSPLAQAFVQFLETDELCEMLTILATMRSVSGIAEDRCGLHFYDWLKDSLTGQLNYSQQQLFSLLDHKRVARPTCEGLKVVIVGAGPVGLRTAIELLLVGADVLVLEKRPIFSRHNILHLWDWVCSDLLDLGATGADIIGTSFFHIGTKRLQALLARAAILLGCRIRTGVLFKEIARPASCEADALWRVHFESLGGEDREYHIADAHVLLGAGGSNDPVGQAAGIAKSHTRISSAIGLVVNFENQGSDVERRLDEFSWASQFNRELFGRLKEELMPMENVVYYQGDTHYFVCTPKIDALVSQEVFRSAEGEVPTLLRADNVNQERLLGFARKLATFFGLPGEVPFVDGAAVTLFDFSSRCSACESAKYLVSDEGGQQLLVCLVGDALMEPFWPEGLGINRGFLGALDAVWMISSYHSSGKTADMDAALVRRSELYERMKSLSAFTKDRILRDDYKLFKVEPASRYRAV